MVICYLGGCCLDFRMNADRTESRCYFQWHFRWSVPCMLVCIIAKTVQHPRSQSSGIQRQNHQIFKCWFNLKQQHDSAKQPIALSRSNNYLSLQTPIANWTPRVPPMSFQSFCLIPRNLLQQPISGKTNLGSKEACKAPDWCFLQPLLKASGYTQVDVRRCMHTVLPQTSVLVFQDGPLQAFGQSPAKSSGLREAKFKLASQYQTPSVSTANPAIDSYY